MGLSCLIDPTAPVVVDASTVINLNATSCGPRILKAIPNPFIITDVVQGELLEDRRSGRQDGQLVAELLALGLISVAKLDDLTESHFGVTRPSTTAKPRRSLTALRKERSP